MARINIEDSIFKSKPFEKLLLKLGSRRAALGALVEAFMLAQKHYLSVASARLIPLGEWQEEEICDELISCGFAEVREYGERESGVYVFGSDDQFKWLIQKQEAGRKGGLAKANTLDMAIAGASGCLADVSGSKPLPLSPPLPQEEKEKLLSLCNDASPKSGGWKELLRIYNENRGGLPLAKGWNKQRERAAALRWKELPDADEWEKVIKYFSTSPHHAGQNDRGWTASFDFILQPGRWLQAQEAGQSKFEKRNHFETSSEIARGRL